MDAKTIAVVDNVTFMQSGKFLIASQVERDDAGMFEPEVVKGAKLAGLPVDGWRKSNFTESFLLEV